MQGELKTARGLEKSASRTRDATSVDFAINRELKTLKKMYKTDRTA